MLGQGPRYEGEGEPISAQFAEANPENLAENQQSAFVFVRVPVECTHTVIGQHSSMRTQYSILRWTKIVKLNQRLLCYSILGCLKNPEQMQSSTI